MQRASSRIRAHRTAKRWQKTQRFLPHTETQFLWIGVAVGLGSMLCILWRVPPALIADILIPQSYLPLLASVFVLLFCTSKLLFERFDLSLWIGLAVAVLISFALQQVRLTPLLSLGILGLLGILLSITQLTIRILRYDQKKQHPPRRRQRRSRQRRSRNHW